MSPPAGHRLFARYAHAPNALGYCGPPGSGGLPAVACGRATDDSGTPVDVPALARRFSGAWPYQQVLAELSGVGDPLDARVVRAYWTGNELTDGIDLAQFGKALLARLAPQAGRYWTYLTEDLLEEAAPTHAFHVLGVYPWSRLLGAGPEPLRILDSCRIRDGTVVAVGDEQAVVRTRRLHFDDRGLTLGPDEDEAVAYRVRDGAFVADLRAGDAVALHWNFVCDRLDSEEVDSLQYWTDWQLTRTNRRLASAR